MNPGLPKQMWIKKLDGTMKLVDRSEFLKAVESLPDQSNGYQPPKLAEVVQPGLGTLMAKTLAAVGVKKSAGCNCGRRQAAMDRATPAWLRPLLAPLVRPSQQPSASAVPASSTR